MNVDIIIIIAGVFSVIGLICIVTVIDYHIKRPYKTPPTQSKLDQIIQSIAQIIAAPHPVQKSEPVDFNSYVIEPQVSTSSQPKQVFETEKVVNRVHSLIRKNGTEFMIDEKAFCATINDILYDLKLERTALINSTSVNVGKILLAAQGLSQEEKRKAANKVKDKLLNEAAFSEDGANFVVIVLSTALGWNKVKDKEEWKI